MVTGGRWFEAQVHVLRQASIPWYAAVAQGRQFNIRFKFNRIPVRRQHLDMNAVFTEDRVLFPLITLVPGGRLPSRSHVALKPFSPVISGKLQAVVSVVAQRPGSQSFVVFGL
jgi:helicase MOV-10